MQQVENSAIVIQMITFGGMMKDMYMTKTDYPYQRFFWGITVCQLRRVNIRLELWNAKRISTETAFNDSFMALQSKQKVYIR